jgi:subtilisin-like proprotein convertase family protein
MSVEHTGSWHMLPAEMATRKRGGMRMRRIAIGVVTAGLLAAVAAAAGAVQPGPPAGARAQLDVRSGERAAVPAGVRAARHALAERLGIEAHVATDPVGGGIRVLARTNGFLSGPHAGDAADVALAYVRTHGDVFGIAGADLAALRLTQRTTSNDGVTHLTWVPVDDGVPAYDSALRVHVTRDGRVAAASGPPLGGLSLATTTPRLTASQALAIAQNDVGAKAGLPRAATGAGPQRATRFSNGDRASLVAFESPGGDRLAWRVTVAGKGPYVFEEIVDAASGELLARHSLTDFASNASVFDYHPGAASGGTQQLVDISRWLAASATTLTGPNAHAYADPDNDDDFADAGEEIGPSAGSNWLYPQVPVAPAGGQSCSSFSLVCTWDGANTGTEATNRNQAATQVFYYVNTFHDWLAQDPIGFTDASGNFEVGGTGGDDPVLAEADDGGDFDNANMATFPDGTSPRMQMYLFKGLPGLPWPAVNGGDDASVVYHEYTHGLSNRLIGDGDGLNANQSGAMGEGWSDWYAMDYLVAHSFVADTGADGEVIVGEYVTNDRTRGIRRQPLDCAVGSGTPACGGSGLAGHSGGFTYADLGRVGGFDASTPSFEVHDDGEIWSETLWDLRKTVGPATARELITNAMRLSPLDPSFLDERDAILLADQAVDGGANHDTIWQLFATRGMGFGARTTSPNATRATASFATPHLVEGVASAYDDSGAFGDGDGVAEPGELLRFAVQLENPGVVSLTNVHGTLSSATPGASVVVPDAGFGTIAAGDSSGNATDYVLTLAPALACGSQVQLTLHVTSDQGAFDVPLVLPLGAGDSVFSASDGSRAIPDAVPTGGAVSSLTVPSGGRIDHLRVTLDVTHTFVGDLHAWLTSPGGTRVDLLEQPGFSSIDWNGSVTFDDSASDAIQDIPPSGAALSGSFIPNEPLATFAGEDRAGTWRLRIADNASADVGTLNGWSIDTDQPSCSTSTTLPVATTGDATGLSTSGATLAGSIDPGGAETAYRFDYGTTSGYGQTTATASAGAGSGAVGESAAVSGLAAATTYHYRIVAFRDGVQVAAGADGTFTTTSGSIAPPLRPVPPPSRTTPSVSSLTRRASVNARGAFVFAFNATPGLSGSVRFTLPKQGRVKAIVFGRRSFSVPGSGRVRLTIKLSRRALAQLRRRHRATVRVTIKLGGATSVRRLTLVVARPRR